MTLYEFNQAGYLSMRKMTKKELQDKSKDIQKFIDNNKGKYFMLVCNELKYYTLFHTDPKKIFPITTELLSIVIELGDLKAIEINDSMVEFWIQKDGECHMYAFFNYDRGVIEV